MYNNRIYTMDSIYQYIDDDKTITLNPPLKFKDVNKFRFSKDVRLVKNVSKVENIKDYISQFDEDIIKIIQENY